MNWSNAQLAEIKYYCTSTRCRTSFPCYPFSSQIETILEIFFFYSIKKFKIEDVKEFYRTLRIPKPRSDGLRNPSPRQIAQALGRMENVRHLEGDCYQITDANITFYADELEYGYGKGFVQYFLEEHTC